MARYDYKCSSCGNVFEVEHPHVETPEVVCPSCGAALKTFPQAGGISSKAVVSSDTDQRSGGSICTNATSGCCANCPHSH
ncbi:MAG: FmdB family zinc ribbon protein [Collinsella sp.]